MHPRAIVRRLRIALGAWLIDVGVRVTSAGERMLPAAPREVRRRRN